jgi:5-deoxy-glucuronate isomerase
MKSLFRAGELSKEGWAVCATPELEGWTHTGLRVGIVEDGSALHLKADDNERVVIVLEGSGLTLAYRGSEDGVTNECNLGGRHSVFSGPSDMLYVPRSTELSISGNARFLVAEALSAEDKQARFVSAQEVPVFVRGAGRESREVHNYGVPETLDAGSLIVVEVLVPSGNWSGVPAHKHDEYIPEVESNLEEIYYFETASSSTEATAVTDPTGIVRVFASDSRPIDVTSEVRNGDVLLVPYGWHGPVAASPGSDLYFFNVMAGPDPVRAWNITNHPAQDWIRETWQHQDADPRLPFSSRGAQ